MRISERGQITIPKKLRDRYGMHHDVEVEVAPTEGGILIRKRTTAEHPVDRVVRDPRFPAGVRTSTWRKSAAGDHRR